LEDHEIVELYWQRNETAIRETDAAYGHYCRAIAYRILNNTQDCAECVNDAYMSAWNRMPPHRPALLGPFLGKITRNLALKRWQDMHAQKRSGTTAALVYEELADCIPASGAVDDHLQAQELSQLISRFLYALPAVERQIFVRRYWYMDGIVDIARRYGFGESKVKSMLHRTRRKLWSELVKEGVLCESGNADGCNRRDCG